MMMKDSLFLLISDVIGRACVAGRGPLMTMNDSLFLLISNVLGKGCGAGEGPTNDDEGFFVSANLKCFRNGVCDRVWSEEGPLMMM